jgi:hypothetical protein
METGLHFEVAGKESNLKGLGDHINGRTAFAAVYAYWRTNHGSAWCLKWWEQQMLSRIDELHIVTVVELCEAFKYNRTHHRNYLKDMITNHFKQMTLDKWKDEVEYNQRMLYNLMKELQNLDYWDKDIWQKCWDTIGHKTRINNITYLSYFNDIMNECNEDP